MDGETTDGRRVYRLTFDVLAAPHQVERIVDLVGRALCGAGEGHSGPCALAWSARHTDGESLVGEEFDRDTLRALRDDLAAVDVLPAAVVDRHLAR